MGGFFVYKDVNGRERQEQALDNLNLRNNFKRMKQEVRSGDFHDVSNVVYPNTSSKKQKFAK